jgi:hypothetical protein
MYEMTGRFPSLEFGLTIDPRFYNIRARTE